MDPKFDHPSEPHSLDALFQTLIRPLDDTGAPRDSDAIFAAAMAHLLARFQ
jgi:hypothetical protein